MTQAHRNTQSHPHIQLNRTVRNGLFADTTAGGQRPEVFLIWPPKKHKKFFFGASRKGVLDYNLPPQPAPT